MITFSSAEKIAILALNKAMVLADGVVDDKEKALSALVMLKLGVTESEATIADAMSISEAVVIVKKATPEKKKFVCGLLGSMMAVDNDIDPKEQLLWGLLTNACGFPTMSVVEAIESLGDFLGK